MTPIEHNLNHELRAPNANPPPNIFAPRDVAEETAKTDFSRIRCPRCKWQPTETSRWCCVDCAAPEFFFGGCWTEWNTFATRGRCPGCAHQWRYTACLRCDQFSLHEDWYANDAA